MQASRSLQQTLRRLLVQHEELARLCDAEALGRRNETVSAWSVGEHLEHLALANAAILAELGRLDAPGFSGEPGGKPTWVGRLALWTGYIPRGRGQAPESMVPRGAAEDELCRRFAMLHERLQALAPRLGELERCRATLPHPLLGQFRASHWLRFADIHDRHHLAIIRDMGRAHSKGRTA